VSWTLLQPEQRTQIHASTQISYMNGGIFSESLTMKPVARMRINNESSNYIVWRGDRWW